MTEELLRDSVALVTGGGQGLGLAFVRLLVENGAYVSLIDISEETGTKAVSRLEKECESWVGKILFIKCDVTSNDEFEDAFKKTVEKFGKVNLVVNNAGIMTKFVDSWEKSIDLNYKATVRGTILGLKYIENKVDRSSAVINVGSIVGLSNSILPIYQSTKRAVIEFTRSFGCPDYSKASGNNIRIMAICPGTTFDGFENDAEGKKRLEEKLKMLIIGDKQVPDPKKVILIQSTKYIQAALVHVMKHGNTGEVWIAENEEPPRLLKKSIQY